MQRMRRPAAALAALLCAALALWVWRMEVASPAGGRQRAAWLSPAYGLGRVMQSSGEAGASVVTLATHPSGIIDFALDPAGGVVASLIIPRAGESGLWVQALPHGDASPVAVCASRQCSGPAWSPDGALLAFDVADAQNPDRASLWIHDVRTHTDRQVEGQPDGGLRSAHWAPSGHVLAGFSQALSEIRIVDLDNLAQSAVAARAGELLAWAPDAQRLVYGTFEFAGERQLHRLMLLDFRAGASRPVTEPADAPVTSVVWSPAGDQVAFSQSNGAGREIRLLDLASERVRVLAAPKGATYGGLAWSPDGAVILAVRAALGTPSNPPSVWSIRVDTGDARLIATDASLPQWSRQ